MPSGGSVARVWCGGRFCGPSRIGTVAAQEVRWVGGDGVHGAAFDIDPDVKHRLLNGLDDIALTLEQGASIDSYERDRERAGPVTTAI